MIDSTVGRSRYEAACDWARRTAAGTGASTEWPVEWPDRLGDVPHDLAHPIWFEDDRPIAERFTWGLRLLREMPCYASAMYASGELDKVTTVERGPWWAGCAELLDSPDPALADPVGYWLWVDVFERPALAVEAWLSLTGPPPIPDIRLRRLLALSGPVPWRTKAPLLHQLASQPQWHGAVLEALVGAAFDIYGSVDPLEARQLLQRTGEAADAQLVALLRERLSA